MFGLYSPYLQEHASFSHSVQVKPYRMKSIHFITLLPLHLQLCQSLLDFNVNQMISLSPMAKYVTLNLPPGAGPDERKIVRKSLKNSQKLTSLSLEHHSDVTLLFSDKCNDAVRKLTQNAKTDGLRKATVKVVVSKTSCSAEAAKSIVSSMATSPLQFWILSPQEEANNDTLHQFGISYWNNVSPVRVVDLGITVNTIASIRTCTICFHTFYVFICNFRNAFKQ